MSADKKGADRLSTDVTPPPVGVQDRVLEHEYDGIREYDNPMPRWWLMSFAGTIVFSVVYMFNVGPVGNGKGRIADYEAEVAAQAALHPTAVVAISDDVLRADAKNAAVVAEGKKVFSTSCASCHGPEGGGIIGPNLVDEYWLHGGKPSEIYKTVAEGVLAKGMPPWSKMLKPDQVKAVVVYITSIAGSHPANPKAPQGTIPTP